MHFTCCRCGAVVELGEFLLLSTTMEGLAVNDVPPACEGSQSHQYAEYGYSSSDSLSYASATSAATLQHSTPLTHSSCAEAAAASSVVRAESTLAEDCARKVASTSYSVSSSSRQSPPLSHQAGVAVSAVGSVPPPPPPRSSDVQRQMSQCSGSYHSRCPVLPSSSSSSSSLCRETAKASQLEPPKKPLTPYMRFSKSVRTLLCMEQKEPLKRDWRTHASSILYNTVILTFDLLTPLP